MSRKTEVICDGCGDDLTYTRNSIDYYIHLDTNSRIHRGNIMTDVAIQRPIDKPHDFCDLICLDHWSMRRRHIEESWRKWHDNWVSEHGTCYGTTISYPSAPLDTLEEKAKEFTSAALEAFPMSRPKT